MPVAKLTDAQLLLLHVHAGLAVVLHGSVIRVPLGASRQSLRLLLGQAKVFGV